MQPTCFVCATELATPADCVYPVDGYYRRPYCEDCVEQCDDCGNVYADIGSHLDYRCRDCDEYRCPSVVAYCDDCEEYVCNDCGYCDRHSEHVRDWNYRPSPWRPKGEYRPGNPLMGLELEIHGSQSDIVRAVHAVDDSEQHLYLKNDGSINGAEIVSHPATLIAWRNFDYGTVLDKLRRFGCASHDYGDCDYGLHVHVSRRGFYGDIHRAVWLLFVHSISDRIAAVARRDSDRWAAWRIADSYYSGRIPLPRLAGTEGIGDAERYVAVNVRNDRTYELRVFGSTLKVAELYAALELVHATVLFTADKRYGDIVNGRTSWAAFYRFITDGGNKLLYKHLIAECVRLGIATTMTGGK